MSLIVDIVNLYIPSKRKSTPSGWISFNAICCQHNGNSVDTRQRGGIFVNDGISYHCFNCGFKTSWTPGRTLSIKFKKFLKWLNVPDDQITKCTFEALRLKEQGVESQTRSLMPVFYDLELPRNSKLISSYIESKDIPPNLIPVLEYLKSRNLYLEDYNFYWCEEPGFNERLIIPFYYEGRIVGWTGRKVKEGKPKYLSEQQPGYVFNLDRQKNSRKCVVVVEGPFDAISIDAVALTGSEINKDQHLLIERLQKEVIVVPDRDLAGKKLIDQAIKYNWGVSMPDWDSDVNDVNDAVKRYGRIYTLWSILNATETMPLKIQLKQKYWLKDIK
jgi:hypothetical protein